MMHPPELNDADTAGLAIGFGSVDATSPSSPTFASPLVMSSIPQ
jgi:hypothetical protein